MFHTYPCVLSSAISLMFLTDLKVTSLQVRDPLIPSRASSWTERSLSAREKSAVAGSCSRKEFPGTGKIQTHHLQGECLLVQSLNDLVVRFRQECAEGRLSKSFCVWALPGLRHRGNCALHGVLHCLILASILERVRNRNQDGGHGYTLSSQQSPKRWCWGHL